MKFQYVISSILVGSALILAGCGKDKADATRDFKDVKLVKPNGEAPHVQEMQTAAFRITPLGFENANSTPYFTEGEPGSIRFKLDIRSQEIKAAKLVPMPGVFPEGATLTPSDEAGVWIMNWTPPVGYSLGKSDAQVAVNVNAQVLNIDCAQNPRVCNFGGKLEYPLRVPVKRDTSSPILVGDTTLPTTMNEGENKRFSITVKNTSKTSNQIPYPELTLYRRAKNLENPKYNGLGFIKADSLESFKNADGSYTYNYVFKTEGMNVMSMADSTIDPNGDGINLCFTVRAAVVGSESSPNLDPCTRVMFAAQAPIFIFSDDKRGERDFTPITPGEENTIEFDVAFPEGTVGEGTITLKKTAGLATWPVVKGAPRVSEPVCEPSAVNPSFLTCKIKWTPPCKLPTKLPVLNLRASNQFGGKKPKESATTRKFVIASPSSCESPEKAVTAVSAPTSPAEQKMSGAKPGSLKPAVVEPAVVSDKSQIVPVKKASTPVHKKVAAKHVVKKPVKKVTDKGVDQ